MFVQFRKITSTEHLGSRVSMVINCVQMDNMLFVIGKYGKYISAFSNVSLKKLKVRIFLNYFSLNFHLDVSSAVILFNSKLMVSITTIFTHLQLGSEAHFTHSNVKGNSVT